MLIHCYGMNAKTTFCVFCASEKVSKTFCKLANVDGNTHTGIFGD